LSGWRLPAGGLIDRTEPRSFRWQGRLLAGYEGDTLASALLANGISIVGRSFKYHRPRGLLAAGLEEPNAIVQLGTGASTVPNLKATQVELFEGLEASPVNVRPSAEFDLMAVNGWFKRFIPAAFYYKTFMWPAWRWFEPAIRRAAGLGTAPCGPDPDRYEHRNAHVDVLVIGAGASGLSAAIAAAEAGKSVMLVERDRALGGGLLSGSGEQIEELPAPAWLSETEARLRASGNVTVLRRTLAFGYYDHDLVGLYETLAGEHCRERLWRVRARRTIFACGAFERPLAFVNNDLPNIMLASAARTYAHRYAAVPGQKLVIATNNDSAYETAFSLHDLGVRIEAILDSRMPPPDAACAAAQRSIPIFAETLPVKALGRRSVRGVVVAPVAGAGRKTTIDCDCLLMSGGWNPAVHLHSQSGGKLRYDTRLQAFLPAEAAQNTIGVGGAAGIFDLQEAITGARLAAAGEAVQATPGEPVGPVPAYGDGAPEAHGAWLDFQNDVTVGDLQLAARENFRSVEHVKRYTTLGMASDQGKTSNVNAIQSLSHLLGKAPDEVGTTKFRPPFDPVTIGAFAGRSVGSELMPLAKLSAHERHLGLGAALEPYGGWLRPAYYARAGESEAEAVAREVIAVRSGAGLFEASPLGKIEVRGPDAAAFLDRMYLNTVSSLKPGRCRYALMLSEHGIVYDDGVIARLADDRFLVGTTSGHAASVADIFNEWLQCEWPNLRVLTQNVTTGWAVMNVAGPRARDVLFRIGTDIDLRPDAFAHMHYREGRLHGVPARVQRVSFTGELSFEIAVPWRFGEALFDEVMEAGKPFGIAPFGVEALMVMRIEKGVLHVGADTDGPTYPQDIGFGETLAKKKVDFVGRRSSLRPSALGDDRRQLVGLATDQQSPLPVGGHVLPVGKSSGTDGWITSAALSPTLRRPVALALVTRGRSRLGEQVRIWDGGSESTARIVDPRFYDPAGQRLGG
jgi:sarcosine oxidase subunit alpha